MVAPRYSSPALPCPAILHRPIPCLPRPTVHHLSTVIPCLTCLNPPPGPCPACRTPAGPTTPFHACFALLCLSTPRLSLPASLIHSLPALVLPLHACLALLCHSAPTHALPALPDLSQARPFPACPSALHLDCPRLNTPLPSCLASLFRANPYLPTPVLACRDLLLGSFDFLDRREHAA